MDQHVIDEINKRRTFAIISHPDAGKTTLTEKFLLYGGAINLAGSVKGKATARHAVSDWMEIEKQRGISVTSSALQFDYADCCINILDTPGHEDFSEDTYRTLMAADSAVMVIDASKGVEAQTRKLFKVCAMRHIPIFTFINKMDRDARDTFELLEDIENNLGIETCPVNWPLGSGKDFKGIYERSARHIVTYSDTMKGTKEGTETHIDIDDAGKAKEVVGEDALETLTGEIELLDGAGAEFDLDKIRAGELTPVFFGSALQNFGVEIFLRAFLQMATPPVGRVSADTHEGTSKKTSSDTPSDPATPGLSNLHRRFSPLEGKDLEDNAGAGEVVEDSEEGTVPRSHPLVISPTEHEFTAFVFKIQANMNPAHRDRIAFMRICSGRYDATAEVKHVQSGKVFRLSQPQQLMADERKVLSEAYAGDIMGVFDPGIFSIGDTVCMPKDNVRYEGIPTFAPEHFARVRQMDTMKRKQFVKGITQIAQEGAIQIFQEYNTGMEEIIVGVVGVLQFDVLKFRLQSEYNVEIRLDPLPYEHIRWVENEDIDMERLTGTSDMKKIKDMHDRPLLLFVNEWSVGMTIERNNGLVLSEFRKN